MKGKKWLVIALAVVILGGVATGAALAATTPQTTGNAATQAFQFGQVFLDKLAGALGIDRSKLDQAISSAANQTVDQAQQQGEITQQQADKLRSRIGKGGFPLGGGFGIAPGKGRPVGFLKPMADALGMTPQDLQAALQQGKTVADLATAKGLTVAQVQDKILAAIKAQLDQAVKSGKLTQDKADQAYTQMDQRFQSGDWVNQLGKAGKKLHSQGPKQAQPQQ